MKRRQTRRRNPVRRRFKPIVCRGMNMTFEECELAILRQAVDDNQKVLAEKLVNQTELQKNLVVVIANHRKEESQSKTHKQQIYIQCMYIW